MQGISREYGVRIIPESERPLFGANAAPPRRMQELEERLREQLGPGTEVRPAPGRGLLFVRVEAAGAGYWIGFPLLPPPAADEGLSRAALWSLVIAGALLIAAFLFARYLARPLRDLGVAVERIGRGETPAPLPEHGPSEIVTLNRGVNRMMASLRQLEHDRAVLLAGVSHDLRTPLARLRLGIEMEARDEATRAGMVDDIEEMDRIIGQFLEFAQNERERRHRASAMRTRSSAPASSAARGPATTCASRRAPCRRSRSGRRRSRASSRTSSTTRSRTERRRSK